jgi:acetoacetate decarboxylase
LFDTVACASYRRLDASIGASEPHDFAVRVSTVRQTAPAASTASRPALMTLRNAPLWDGTARISEVIWVRLEEKYFFKKDWTAQISLNAQENLA